MLHVLDLGFRLLAWAGWLVKLGINPIRTGNVKCYRVGYRSASYLGRIIPSASTFRGTSCTQLSLTKALCRTTDRLLWSILE